jgi:hypothetical protein
MRPNLAMVGLKLLLKALFEIDLGMQMSFFANMSQISGR